MQANLKKVLLLCQMISPPSERTNSKIGRRMQREKMRNDVKERLIER